MIRTPKPGLWTICPSLVVFVRLPIFFDDMIMWNTYKIYMVIVYG